MVNEQELKQMHDKIAELEESVIHQRARADRAETFICTMCAECEWEVKDEMLFMQKSCCSLFPLDCGKFKLRVTDNNVGCKWIPVTERLPEYDTDVLTFRGTAGFCIECYHTGGWGFDNIFMDDITHWIPLPEPPKEVE